MHELRKTSLYSFAVLPVIGLVFSAMTHVAVLSGKDGPLGNYTLLLHLYQPCDARSAIASTNALRYPS